jgi:putative transposase
MTGEEINLLHGRGLSYGRLSRVMSIPKATLGYRANKGRRETSRLVSKPKPNALWEWVRMLKEIKPTWGIRRVRAWIRKALMIPIGRKRTARILREQNLLCPRIKKMPGRREKPKTEAKRPKELFATDMTQFMLTTGRALYLVVVLDVFTRRIVGWHLSLRCRAVEWLEALDMALNAEFPHGSRGQGLTIRLDNGCQPTSKRFREALGNLEITPEWTGYNSPKQNAHVERVIGTLKADWLWIEECDTFGQAEDLVTRAVSEYNQEHPHSALNYLSPCEFDRAWHQEDFFINLQDQMEITQIAA